MFLRAAVVALGLAVLALCVFALPAGIRTDSVGGYRFILMGLYAPAVPFYVALYQSWKLLGHIDANRAFSELSVKALSVIKNCALAISGLFLAGMPYVYIVAERDDAPGVILIGLVFIGASLVVAVFAALLQKLLKEALAIKSEIDLTV